MINWIKEKYSEVKSHFGYGQTEAEQLKEKINSLSSILPKTLDTLNKQSGMIKELYKQEGLSEEQAQKNIQSIFTSLDNLQVVLNDLSEIVRMDKKIQEYLFRQIRRTQFLNIVLSVIIGIIGLVFKGPEFYDRVIKPRISPDAISSEYANDYVLKNIKDAIEIEDFENAIRRIDKFLSEDHKENIKAQAQIYKQLIFSLQGKEFTDILSEITKIKTSENYIKSQRNMLIAILHSKNNNFPETTKLLNEIIDQEEYRNFVLEAKYYDIITTLEQGGEQDFERAKRLIESFRDVPSDYSFFDLYFGKPRQNKRDALNVINQYFQVRESQIKSEKEKIIYDQQRKSIRITVKYNTYTYNGLRQSNPDVKAKAQRIHDMLSEKFGDNLTPLSAINATDNGYVDNNVFYRGQLNQQLFNNEIKQLIPELKRFVFYSGLEKRYTEDIVIIVSK